MPKRITAKLFQHLDDMGYEFLILPQNADGQYVACTEDDGDWVEDPNLASEHHIPFSQAVEYIEEGEITKLLGLKLFDDDTIPLNALSEEGNEWSLEGEGLDLSMQGINTVAVLLLRIGPREEEK